MNVRQPIVAGSFYEAGRGPCARAIERCLAEYEPPNLGPLVGGVAPHAGWMCSGPTAAKVFLALRPAAPSTFVLFGAVHNPAAARQAAVFPEGAWSTPLGDLPVDAELADEIVSQSEGRVIASARAHGSEHSIEVQAPFIKHLFPQANIVPISVPPTEDAPAVGAMAGRVLAGHESAVVVGSTDLTHYGMNYFDQSHGSLPGALPWMKENDQRIITLAENLRAEEIVDEAALNRNACGAGALAAVTAAARELGAVRGRLLEYTTSAEVIGDLHGSSAVGYAAIVFCK